MPLGHAWYVEATKRAFPYATKLVSGPHDAADVHGQVSDLADAFPDCTLAPKLVHRKTLPEISPRFVHRGAVHAFDDGTGTCRVRTSSAKCGIRTTITQANQCPGACTATRRVRPPG
jgi:hypothetical protein